MSWMETQKRVFALLSLLLCFLLLMFVEYAARVSSVVVSSRTKHSGHVAAWTCATQTHRHMHKDITEKQRLMEIRCILALTIDFWTKTHACVLWKSFCVHVPDVYVCAVVHI